jgi:predicted O-methyltransferase YrrM
MKPDRNAHKDITGHLWDNDATVLQTLAAGLHVLEIGTCTGKSAVALAATAAKVTTIDWGIGDDQMLPFSTDVALQNIRDFAGPELVEVVVADWTGFVGIPGTTGSACSLGDFDMVFYDAAHVPPYAYELEFLVEAEKFPGLLIAIHDYKPREPEFRYAAAAIDDFERRTGRLRIGPVDGSSVCWFLGKD